MDTEEKLQAILEKAVDHKKVFGTSFCIQYKDSLWEGSAGNLHRESPYFIASTTKLFVTAVILRFQSKRSLDIDDKIEKYLGRNILKGLHVLKGVDYSGMITIKDLLAHTSGIPDYFQRKDQNGNSWEDELLKGNDRAWTFDEAIEYSKTLKPLFVPGEKGKAHYADTNFQLLGKIIENVTGEPVDGVFKELIYKPLGMSTTYLYRNINDTAPKCLYHKSKELHIPKAMSSFGPDGGVVSTSKEMLVFLHTFFNGVFFPTDYIEKLKVWNKIFSPMQAGIGIHRFKLPRLFDPAGVIPELIGHSGLSGALAYYAPSKDLYITGTVNQTAFPDTSFRLAIRLIREITRR